MEAAERVPGRGWVVTFAGTAVNLCLGILYAWSVWKSALIGTAARPAGTAMTGLDEGWTYLSDTAGTQAYALCGLVFALCMIPGGRIQDRYGPRVGATLGGLFLAVGCVVAGLMKSHLGLILGFGLLGGAGMGLGYAAATPAAVKWFGPHRRALIVGIVVAGYGGAALYIAPLAKWLIANVGLTGSFVGLGIGFAIVVTIAGQLLTPPPADYRPPTSSAPAKSAMTRVDWTPRAMLGTWQFYALVLLFLGSAQSGLLVIANAALLLRETAAAEYAHWLPAFGGFVNAFGRVGTGWYADRLGRRNAYLLNAVLAAACLFATPAILGSGNVVLIFAAMGVAYWQYGGGLALLPSFTADFYGAKNLGTNYGLVFLGWGFAFFVPQLAALIKDYTGSLDVPFYLSAGLLSAAALLACVLARPLQAGETR